MVAQNNGKRPVDKVGQKTKNVIRGNSWIGSMIGERLLTLQTTRNKNTVGGKTRKRGRRGEFCEQKREIVMTRGDFEIGHLGRESADVWARLKIFIVRIEQKLSRGIKDGGSDQKADLC